MVKHLVFWKVKEPKEENIGNIKHMLEMLRQYIPEIRELEVGINYNSSPTAFDISLYSSFDSNEDLEKYQKHPEHVKAGNFIKVATTERAVVDYEI